MNTTEVRRENLRAIANTLSGGQAELAERLSKHPVQINQWIGRNPTRAISARSARAIETTLGIPVESLDESTEAEVNADALAEAMVFIDGLLSQADGLNVSPRNRALAIIAEYNKRKTAAEKTTEKEANIVQMTTTR
jgi:DNA-binding transcriptional regulator YdaS (Cro superfamily)